MVKKISYCMITCVIMLLPSCWHIPMYREFSQVSKRSQVRTGESVQIKSTPCLESEQDILETQVKKGMSRDDANRFALENNPGLQASFQNVGIAKADLVQAGFLTNPELNIVSVLLPDVDVPADQQNFANTQNSLATVGSFRLDDFWKRPFQTQLACFQLKAVMAQVEEEILRIKRDTQIAYNLVMYRLAEYRVSSKFVKELEKIYEILKKEKKEAAKVKNGKTKITDIDVYTVETILGSEKLRQINAYNGIFFAFSQLRNLTGMWVSPEEVSLSERLFDYKPILPDLVHIISELVEKNPRVLAAAADYYASEKGVSLERASVIEEVRAGFVTDRSEGVNSFGPAFNITIPLFNANQAQIARAKYFFDKSEKTLFDTRRNVTNNIIKSYYDLKAALDNLDIYEKFLEPAFDEGIKVVLNYPSTEDELDTVLLIRSLNTFYDTKLEYLIAQQRALDLFAELEFFVGGQLIHYASGLHKYHIDMEY